MCFGSTGFLQWGTEGRCGYFISRNESWSGSSLSFRRGGPCAWSADLVVALVSRAFPLRLFLRFHTNFGSDGPLPSSPRVQTYKLQRHEQVEVPPIPPCGGGGPRISGTTFQTSKFQFPNIHLFKILSAPIHPSITEPQENVIPGRTTKRTGLIKLHAIHFNIGLRTRLRRSTGAPK